MSALALSGTPPGPHHSTNVAEWIFSNPFNENSEIMKHAPKALRSHTIPMVKPEKPLFVDPTTNTECSWSQTRQNTLRLAAGLHELGLKPTPSSKGDPQNRNAIISPVIMIHLPNCIPMATTMFGVFAAGLTATLASPALTATELAWLIQSSQPKAIVTTSTTLKTVHAAIEAITDDTLRNGLKDVRIYVVDLNPTASHSPSNSSSSWEQLLHNKPLNSPVSFSSEHECRQRTAVILWSSGTTGRSKGVLLSHHSLTTSVASLWHVYPTYNGEERFLGIAPFYHVFGLVCCLLLAPSAGSTIYCMPKFDFKTMLDFIAKYKITFLHIAPPIAVHLANNPLVERADLSTVKGAMSGGAPLPTAIVDRVYERVGFGIKLGYGLSETGAVCNQIGATFEEIKSQHGCTGPPLYGNELRIASLEDNRTLQTDQEGEVLIRSPGILNCYLNNKTATDEAIDQDGWFHTGDIGKLDKRGYLWITDRIKEMIKVKGFQVAPAELEAILISSSNISDVAVTSIYNAATATELPRAYIVPANSQLRSLCTTSNHTKEDVQRFAELGQHVKEFVEKRTVHYKWLRGDVVFVPEVPKSSAGKILRRMLKDVKGGVPVTIYPAKQVELAKL